MKDKIGQQVYYNRSKSVDRLIWQSVRTQWPLPIGYTEVEYIQNGRKDCIVIDDLLLYHAEPFGVQFKMKLATNRGGAFCGAGHDPNANNVYSYGLSLWVYTGTTKKLVFWGDTDDGGMANVFGNNTPTIIEDTKIYSFDIFKPANGKQELHVKDPDNPMKYLAKYQKTKGLEEYPTKPYGPFAFFSEVQYCETYPGYYGWPATYRPQGNAHRGFVDTYSIGLYSRLYSNILFYNPDTMEPEKYLYTCFRDDTHQYGLYDSMNNIFYGGFEEGRLGYWNNTDYYWNNIKTASGDTRFAKEKTFINICGPGTA